MRECQIFVTANRRDNVMPITEVSFKSKCNNEETKKLLIKAVLNMVKYAENYKGIPLTTIPAEYPSDVNICAIVTLMFPSEENLKEFIFKLRR